MKTYKLKQKRQHKRHEKQEWKKQTEKEVLQEEFLKTAKMLSPTSESLE